MANQRAEFDCGPRRLDHNCRNSSRSLDEEEKIAVEKREEFTNSPHYSNSHRWTQYFVCIQGKGKSVVERIMLEEKKHIEKIVQLCNHISSLRT